MNGLAEMGMTGIEAVQEQHDIVAKWKKRLEQAQAANRQYISMVRKSVAFFMGHQWIQEYRGLWWDRDALNPPPPGTFRRRETVNIFKERIKAISSRILVEKPIPKAIPPSNDASRINACQYANNLIEHWAHSKGLDLKLQKQALAMCLGAMGYWKIYWDSTLEAEVVPQPGEMPRKKIVGDVAFHVLNVAELNIEPGTLNTDEAQWWIHTRLINRGFIENAYRHAPRKSTSDEAAAFKLTGEGEGIPSTEARLNIEYDEKERAIIHECYERVIEGDEYRYRVLIFSGENILTQFDMDYNPFIPVPYHTIDGVSVPHCEAFDLIPLQEELNRAVSRNAEHAQINTHPQWWIPSGTRIQSGQLGKEPGGLIKGIGREPKVLEVPKLSMEIAAYPQQIIMYMDHVSGIHQVSQGMAPYSGSSGKLVQTLQNQDITNLQGPIENFRRAYLRAMTQAITLAQRYYDQPRHITVGGKESYLDVMDFTGAQLEGGTDIRLVMGTSLPMTHENRQNFALTLFQQGAFNPDRREEFKRLMEVMGFGDWNREGDKMEADRDSQELENRFMAQGTPQSVYITDNHEIHLEQLDQFCRTRDYRMLPEEVQMLFMYHRRMHQYSIAQLQLEAMQAATNLSLLAQNPIMPQVGATPSQSPPPLAPPGGGGPAPQLGNMTAGQPEPPQF